MKSSSFSPSHLQRTTQTAQGIFLMFLSGLILLSGCQEDYPQEEDTLSEKEIKELQQQVKIPPTFLAFKADVQPPLLEAETQEETPDPESEGPKNDLESANPKDELIEEINEDHPLDVPPPQLSPKELLKREVVEARLKHQKVLATPLEEIVIEPPKRVRLKDEHYRVWDQKLGEDKSTLPVDRDRVLTTESWIPVILEHSINSQLPGRVIAVVEGDIYSPTKRKILLPAYTKFVCFNESLSKEGETRLSLECHRAILPNGASLLLTKAFAADQMGRTGVIGEIDNRIFDRYGAAFITAGIAAIASAGSNLTSNTTFSNSANNLSNSLGQVTSKVMEQTLHLAPVMTISAGTRLFIIPTTDIWLREPQLYESIEEINHAHK